MKKIIFLFFVLILISSCDNEKSLPQISADVAVETYEGQDEAVGEELEKDEKLIKKPEIDLKSNEYLISDGENILFNNVEIHVSEISNKFIELLFDNSLVKVKKDFVKREKNIDVIYKEFIDGFALIELNKGRMKNKEYRFDINPLYSIEIFGKDISVDLRGDDRAVVRVDDEVKTFKEGSERFINGLEISVENLVNDQGTDYDFVSVFIND